jgi:hypothetical protein
MMYGNGDGTCNAPFRGRREGESLAWARDKRRRVIAFAPLQNSGAALLLLSSWPVEPNENANP